MVMERKHPWANCEECPLLEEGKFCPSDGPEKAELVIVGEAPGANEAAKGVPFIGASGQLLNMVLEHHGFDRENVFVTNTVLCRPRGNANPSVPAIKACGERLHREITSRLPKTIMALGNFAAKRILKTSEGITTLRVGPPKVSEDYPGVRIIPTFHPAATLYNSNSFPDIVTDFQKIKGAVSASTSWEPPEFEVLDDRGASKRLRNLLESGRLRTIAVDIEVGVDKDIDTVHASNYRLLCIGIAYDERRVVVVGENALGGGSDENGLRATLRDVLERGRVICHNGKFDLSGLRQLTNKAELWFDTMLASYALDERRGVHSLEYNSIERLGSPSWKHEVGHYLGEEKDYSIIPRQVLYRYNAYDCVNTFRLWKWFEEAESFTPELRKLHDYLVDASNMLMYVEYNGVTVDLPYLDALTEEYIELLAKLRLDLQEMVENRAYNPNSWQQVQKVLNEQFNTRVPNTQWDNTLQPLMERAARKNKTGLYEFLRTHGEFKKEAKSYGTYVKGTRKRLHEGRVHSTFKLHGTTTGRLSSGNPNLQNVTRGSRLRGLFVPGSSETTLGQADYRQAELRVVCSLARDPYLQSIFNAGRNLHEEVGKIFYGDNFTKADKEKYIRAKAIVFGLTYGREAFSLAAEYRMSEREAQQHIDAFFNVIPDTVEWRKNVWESVRSGGDLVSPFGNHRRFYLITKSNKHHIEKEAYAFLPQNIVSHLLLRAGVRLANEGMRDMLRIPVHDAWVFECTRDVRADVERHVSTVMADVAAEYFTDFVDFPVDVGFGDSWGDLT